MPHAGLSLLRSAACGAIISSSLPLVNYPLESVEQQLARLPRLTSRRRAHAGAPRLGDGGTRLGVLREGPPLLGYLRREVSWVSQQCCVWHLWRGLARGLGQRVSEAAQGLVGEAAQEQVRRELVALMHGVLDAATCAQAETTLAQLEAYRLGVGLAQALWDQLDTAFQPLQQAGQVSRSRTRAAFTGPTLSQTHQHNLQPSRDLPSVRNGAIIVHDQTTK